MAGVCGIAAATLFGAGLIQAAGEDFVIPAYSAAGSSGAATSHPPRAVQIHS